MTQINKRPLLIILSLYVVSNFLMVVNNGVFWDDWCVYNMEYAGIRDIYYGVGLKFMAPITYYLQNITPNPALLYHLLTFTFEFFGIILFYHIAGNFIQNKYHLFCITALYALIPYNETKILMVSLPYTIGLLLFLLATYFLVLHNKGRQLAYRIASLILYFGSFTFLNSTLVLMLGFIAFFIVYLSYNESGKLSLKGLLGKTVALLDFIILPFIYWTFRAMLLKPSGIYASGNYNELSAGNLMKLPKNLLETIHRSLVGLGSEIINVSFSSGYLIAVFVLLSAVLIYLLPKNPGENKLPGSVSIWLIVGAYFFVLGAFAYIAIGKIPSFKDYETRHQILLRFGTPILIMAFFGLFRSPVIQRNLGAILFALFITTSIGQNIKYLSSWFKQMALERAFASSNELRIHKSFLIFDKVKQLNENESEYTFYCFNGLVKKTLTEQSHFMLPLKDLERPKIKKNFQSLISLKNYNMSTYTGGWSFSNYIVVDFNREQPGVGEVMSLLAKQYFFKDDFDQQIRQYINVNYSKTKPTQANGSRTKKLAKSL